MADKDYYGILQVSSSSSQDEIRKAFRRLAMLYHPDATKNDALKTERFKLVKEAYNILSNERNKQEYDARYFLFTKKDAPVTVQSILHEASMFNNDLQRKHLLQLNYGYLIAKLDSILSSSNLHLLENHSNQSDIDAITQSLLKVLALLPHQMMHPFAGTLQTLSAQNPSVTAGIDLLIQQKKREMLWNRYKVPLAFAIAVIACCLIALMSK